MYFQMYGYAIHDVGTPCIKNRERWTYIKTVNSNVQPIDGSGCSAADISNINAVFNGGVTFWVDPNHVGDYNFENVPINGYGDEI